MGCVCLQNEERSYLPLAVKHHSATVVKDTMYIMFGYSNNDLIDYIQSYSFGKFIIIIIILSSIKS